MWRHVIPYLALCAQTIALLVFLNSTQPFVLSQVFGLEQNGSASGVLALVDEVVVLITAPLWGAFSDKIGTRYVAVIGLWLMAAGLTLYPRAPSVYPGLLFVRALFSLGASACVSMMAGALAELGLLQGRVVSDALSRGDSPDPPYDCEGESDGPDTWTDNEADGANGDQTVPLFDSVLAAPRPNGKLAGMTGFASGIGAVLAVSLLLPLPTTLKSGGVDGLVESYVVVSMLTLLVSLVLLLTLYQNPALGIRSLFLSSSEVSIFDEAALDAGGTVISYYELLEDGFLVARSDRRLQLAYFGSLVARSASTILALFVPLWVNQWFYKTGRCTIADPKGCREAVIQAAILTGIANTVTLLAAPLFGWAGDKYGSVSLLSVSALLGIVAMLGYWTVNTVLGFWPILVSCLAGAAQIGVMTMSLSMSTDKRRVSNGSVAGVYSLFGSLGILVVTQLGGPLSDTYVKAPFVVMTILFLLLWLASQRLATRTTLRSSRSQISLR